MKKTNKKQTNQNPLENRESNSLPGRYNTVWISGVLQTWVEFYQ